MTKEELDFIGSMNMFDEISNEAYKKIVNHVEETEISDDCVSRAEMLKYQQYLHGKMSNEENHKLWEFIKDLPSVTPTRKSGLHWIERFDNENKWLECPHCHLDSAEAYNYCPNCGAKFKEEKRGNSDGSN